MTTAPDLGCPWTRKNEAVQALLRLDTDSPLTADQRAEVLDIVSRTELRPADFWALDEGPGRWGYHHTVNGERRAWHHKLRQVRNHRTDGHKLFDILTARLHS